MEQARLDAIARVIQTERPDAQNAKSQMTTGIKMDRKPEYDDDDKIKEMQQAHVGSHKKMDTFEQAKLDAIARLAASDNKQAKAARKTQQNALLPFSNETKENALEQDIRKQIKEEYDEKMKRMQQDFRGLINLLIKREKEALKLLEDSKAQILELEQDKMRLIISTANEIETLRDALRRSS